LAKLETKQKRLASYICLACGSRTVSDALHIPQTRGARCYRGPKIQSRYHLVTQSPRESFDPQIEIWSTRNQLSQRALWKSSAYVLQLLWASLKAILYYNCCWGPLRKKSSLFIQ